MKTLIPISILLLFAACQTSPEAISQAAHDIADQLDRNHDQRITAGETASSLRDPAFWIAMVGAVGSLFGYGKATAASNAAKEAKVATDDLYDATHAPIAKKA